MQTTATVRIPLALTYVLLLGSTVLGWLEYFAFYWLKLFSVWVMKLLTFLKRTQNTDSTNPTNRQWLISITSDGVTVGNFTLF